MNTNFINNFTYRQLQNAIKNMRAAGLTNMKANLKAVILREELKRIVTQFANSETVILLNIEHQQREQESTKTEQPKAPSRREFIRSKIGGTQYTGHLAKRSTKEINLLKANIQANALERGYGEQEAKTYTEKAFQAWDNKGYVSAFNTFFQRVLG